MTLLVVAVIAIAILLQLALLFTLGQSASCARIAINSQPPTNVGDAENACKFYWELWCRECGVGGPSFRAEGTKTLVGLVRDWWESLWPLITLQRLGVMAPLMGVIFTAFGLLTLDQAAANDSAAILGAMKPFGVGIGGGALIAIINQLVLLRSEFLFRGIQEDVSRFAIDAIGKAEPSQASREIVSLPPETQLFLDKLTNGIGPLVGALESASRHLDRSQLTQKACHDAMVALAGGVRQLESQATRQQRATDAYVESIEKVVIPSQKHLQATSKRVSDVADALAVPLEGFVKATERLVAGYEMAAEGMHAFREGTQAFARVVDQGFVPSAEKHHQAANELETMVVRSRQAADGFVGGIARFAKSFEYQHEVTDRIVELIDQQAAPAYELLAKSARTLEGSTTAMAEHAEGFRTAVLEQVALTRQIQETSERAASAIADAGKSLAASSTQVFTEPVLASTKLLERFEAVPRSLESFLESLRETSSLLSKESREQASFTAATESALAATRAAADKLIGVSGSLEKHITTLAQAAKAAGDLYSRFDAVTDGHAEKIRNASEPLVNRLAAVADAIDKLSEHLSQPKRSIIGRFFG
jgi:hypothetical protein